MYDVITVGSSTVDVFAETEFSELIKIRDRKKVTSLLAYPSGSKILITRLEFTTGGGATNTAVALARLGHKVACISKMGCRANAEKIKRHLKRENIDTRLLVCAKNGRTGYSIILDSIEHDRTILAFKGSNNDLRFNEIKINKLKTKWFYFSTMMGESFKTLIKLAKFAQKNNIKIAFNVSEYLANKGLDYIGEILKRTTIFVLNKDEARLLTKKERIQDMLESLKSFGIKYIVITDGKHLVNVYFNNTIYETKPHNIKVVETTGAGDAFAASFLSGIIKKNNVEFAIKLAQTNAESVIRYHGAKNKLLKYREALEIMRKNPIKVTKRRLK